MNHEQFMKRFDKYPTVERYAIEHAYILSKDAHRAQSRQSGERYFEHPRRVAIILMEEIGIGSWEDVCAALLHDGPEDTKYLTIDKLRYWFNGMVADLVDLMTKREGQVQREYYAKLGDMDRAVIIKGCDRLDNLRSMRDLKDDFITKQIHGTETHVLPLLRNLSVGGVYPWASEKAKLLVTLIEIELTKLKAILAERNIQVPCGVYGCTRPRRKADTLCEMCEREYHEDPEAFK